MFSFLYTRDTLVYTAASYVYILNDYNLSVNFLIITLHLFPPKIHTNSLQILHTVQLLSCPFPSQSPPSPGCCPSSPPPAFPTSVLPPPCLGMPSGSSARSLFRYSSLHLRDMAGSENRVNVYKKHQRGPKLL